jgi:nucleoside-diphosphate-sugar epimerase
MGERRVVAMAGGTGFTGRRVAHRLAREADLRCLVRTTSDRTVLPEGVEIVSGDLDDSSTLRQWMSGATDLVYTASMGFGHIPDVVAAAREARIRRAVFVSTTALFTRLPASSKAVRAAAEEAVMGSGLEWTIVRPTMIYGAPGDRNMERLLRKVATRTFIPVPGGGRHLIQPVHVDDLADAIVAAWRTDAAVGQAYDVSGASPLSLNDTIDAAAATVGRRVRRIHAPLAPVAWLLGLCEAVGLRLPLKREQVLRLAEDKAFSHEDAARDLGFAPRAFEVGIRSEATELGLVAEAVS